VTPELSLALIGNASGQTAADGAGSRSESCFAPFWSLPSEFLTGFSAAAGIALINSIGNLSQLVGPYMIGAIAMRTGNPYVGLAIAGVPLFISATLVLLLPRKARDLATA
jgi:hypothetical protein